MKVNLESKIAISLIEKLYKGDSLPLTENKEGRILNNFSWWIKNPNRKENKVRERKHAAIRCYLEIAKNSILPIGVSLPDDSFPAIFDCSDNKSLRPDRGIIKAMYCEKLLDYDSVYGHLIFLLTTNGKLWLSNLNM